ncbi:hypothetical protein [Phytohabitans kaempferiae]|uniref:PknH-like extracellular domain-containing protein n=1 Tax=Phytohabitans kaempferiae TaxID=1620943 RepID=A0ABV6M0K2_9ACTN
MSEQLTVLFEQLRGSRPPAPFAPPDQVRRRGRQRTHRQALAAGSAVLAVAGLGTGWAMGIGGEPAPPAASLSTMGTQEVPGSVMLQPGDFGSVGGVTVSEMDDQGPDGPASSWPGVESCPAFRAADFPTLGQRRDARGHNYTAGTSASWEIVERYPDAAANMADVRRMLAACPAYQPTNGDVQLRQTVVDERFAGDDSLLVRMEFGADLVQYTVVVRVSDLVATLRYDTDDAAEARRMGEPMAARLSS